MPKPELFEPNNNALAVAQPAALAQPTPLSLIRDALQMKVAPDVLKELVALQQSMVRFEWESQERQAKIQFDDALSACQKQIGRVAPNQKRSDTHSWWADYAQVDRVTRPIYTAEGFSISFSEVAPVNPSKIRIMATLSRGGVSREYFSEITPSTTGAKGNALVNATDADGIAQSRAKRYLLLDIFNISVGIDTEEKKSINSLRDEDFIPHQEAIENARTMEELRAAFKRAFTAAISTDDQKRFQAMYEGKKREML